jgi:hypothetical protein
MADELGVHVTGDEELRAKLEKFASLIGDMRLFGPSLVPIFIGWMRDVFASEGAWGGTPWAPLSPTYAAEKGKRYPGRSILIREGALRDAASRPMREVTPRTLTLWIDNDVAPFHQEGTDRMPARPLIPERLPASALREVEDAAREHVNVLIRSVRL